MGSASQLFWVAEQNNEMKRASMRMPFAFAGEGGIVRLSRCIRESLIPHFIRDCLRHPAQAAGGYARAAALNVRKLTLACAATSRCAACCRTRAGSSTRQLNQIKNRPRGAVLYLAEKAGFEPALGYYPKHAFQACDLNHSSTSPKGRAG
jgi:hypothetical protein